MVVGPVGCLIGNANADEADKTVSSRYAGVKQADTLPDAVRHCYWSAIMVMDTGFMAAERIAANHEANRSVSALSSAMDDFNNDAGRQIGLHYNNSAANDHVVAINACVGAANSGRLQVAP